MKIYFVCFSDINNKPTNNAVSATEVKFRGKVAGSAVNRSLEPLPQKYKGKPLTVSLAPENDRAKLTDVSEK